MTNGSELPPHTSLTSVRKDPPPTVMVGSLLKSLGTISIPAQRYSSDPTYWASAAKRYGYADLSTIFKEHFVSTGEGYAVRGHLEVFELTRSGQGIANEIEDYLQGRVDLCFETELSDLSYLLSQQYELGGQAVLPPDNVGTVFFQRSLRTRELFEVSVRVPSWGERRVDIAATPLYRKTGVFSRATRVNGHHIEGRRFVVRVAS